MIRSFIAIALPRPISDLLKSLQGEIRELGVNARLPSPESIHLTLKFLGNIDEDQIAEIESGLSKIGDIRPFRIHASGLGAFPRLADPKVLWVGVSESPALHRLQTRVEQVMDEHGYERDPRSYHPHLTLARIKSRKKIARLISYVEDRTEEINSEEFLVDRFHLYQSILDPSGATYRQLVTMPLNPAG